MRFGARKAPAPKKAPAAKPAPAAPKSLLPAPAGTLGAPKSFLGRAYGELKQEVRGIYNKRSLSSQVEAELRAKYPGASEETIRDLHQGAMDSHQITRNMTEVEAQAFHRETLAHAPGRADRLGNVTISHPAAPSINTVITRDGRVMSQKQYHNEVAQMKQAGPSKLTLAGIGGVIAAGVGALAFAAGDNGET
jgi:hypothetical protein